MRWPRRAGELLILVEPPLAILVGCRLITGAASFSLMPFMLAHLTNGLGLPLHQAVLAMALLSALPGFLGPATGYAHDRFSAKALLLTACALSVGAVSLLSSRAVGAAGVFYAMAMLGTSNSIFNVSLNAAVPRCVATRNLPFAFSLLHATANVGALIGPALAGIMILRGGGTGGILWIAGGCYLLVSCFILWIPWGTHESTDAGPRPASEDPHLRWAAVAYLALLFVECVQLEQPGSFLGKFATDAQQNPSLVAFFFSAQAIPVLILVPWAGGLMLDWSTNKLLAALLCGVLALPIGLACFSLLVSSSFYGALAALGVCMVIDEMLVIPSSGALAARLAPRKRYGAIFGVRSSVMSLGRALGLAVGGALYGRAALQGELSSYWMNAGAVSFGLWICAAALTMMAISGRMGRAGLQGK